MSSIMVNGGINLKWIKHEKKKPIYIIIFIESTMLSYILKKKM